MRASLGRLTKLAIAKERCFLSGMFCAWAVLHALMKLHAAE